MSQLALILLVALVAACTLASDTTTPAAKDKQPSTTKDFHPAVEIKIPGEVILSSAEHILSYLEAHKATDPEPAKEVEKRWLWRRRRRGGSSSSGTRHHRNSRGSVNVGLGPDGATATGELSLGRHGQHRFRGSASYGPGGLNYGLGYTFNFKKRSLDSLLGLKTQK